jgi:hypothetical protein
MLTTLLHLTPPLRMSGVIPLFSLYTYMLWTGTALLLLISIVKKLKPHNQMMYVHNFTFRSWYHRRNLGGGGENGPPIFFIAYGVEEGQIKKLG